MTRDECRKCLRCLELEAYASMVSVLRAQGAFTEEKRKLLQELQKVLHISNERHRAEVRRAVNDEKLSTIAEQLSGPNTASEWSIEGRRSIPLLPRSKARSAFQTLANSLSLATAAANKRIAKNEPEFVNNGDCGEMKAGKEENEVDENVLSEVTESERNITEVCSEKRKLPSPSLPNKVLLLSCPPAEGKERSENNLQLSTQPVEAAANQLQPQEPLTAISQKQRVLPLLQASAKPNSGNSQQRLMVSTVNGPGPPQAITTLKKLALNQNTAKLVNNPRAERDALLQAVKTVNIHQEAKLGAKTNVIVIQKGQSKGVTLSHAGKEVLGKMIMGGKSLCNNASIRHITLNNGEQSANTITFNLLEKNAALSQLLEKTVIQAKEDK